MKVRAELSSAIHYLSHFPVAADMLPLLSSSTSMTSLTMFNDIWKPKYKAKPKSKVNFLCLPNHRKGNKKWFT